MPEKNVLNDIFLMQIQFVFVMPLIVIPFRLSSKQKKVSLPFTRVIKPELVLKR